MDRKVLIRQIGILDQVYPGERDPDTIQILAAVWFEDLGRIPDDEFVAAIRIGRRTWSFFPTPADVLKAHRQVVDEHIRIDLEMRAQIPHRHEPLDPARMREISAKLREKLSKIGNIYPEPPHPAVFKAAELRRKTAAEKRAHAERVKRQAREILNVTDTADNP